MGLITDAPSPLAFAKSCEGGDVSVLDPALAWDVRCIYLFMLVWCVRFIYLFIVGVLLANQDASRGGSPPPDWLPPNGLGAAPAHHASGAPRGAVGEPSLAPGKTVLSSFIHILLFLIPVGLHRP